MVADREAESTDSTPSQPHGVFALIITGILVGAVLGSMIGYAHGLLQGALAGHDLMREKIEAQAMRLGILVGVPVGALLGGIGGWIVGARIGATPGRLQLGMTKQQVEQLFGGNGSAINVVVDDIRGDSGEPIHTVFAWPESTDGKLNEVYVLFDSNGRVVGQRRG